MLRKMLLGAVAAVAVGFGGTQAQAADPFRLPPGGGFGPVVPVGPGFVPPPFGGGFGPGYGTYRPPFGGPGLFPPPRPDFDFVVLVNRGWGWERYGRYETRREAERVECFLEARGFRARVEAVRDFRPW